jgi:hypothetical protein
MTLMNADERCRPDGHQACWPKTSYSARDEERDLPTRTSSKRVTVSLSVTDAPGISRFDRGVA